MTAKRDPIREWREEYARCMLQLDFEPVPDTRFHASTEPLVDGLRIVRSSFSPGFTYRDAELARKGDDSFALLISRSRNISVKKWRHFELGQGDGALMRISDPGALGSTESFRYVAMMIPFRELQARLANVDGLVAERISKTSEGMQLLRGYIRALSTGRRAMSNRGREIIQRHLFDLAALAVELRAPLGESSLSAVGAARLNAAIEIIAARFDQPDLTVASVARALSISPRYLQRLFEMIETTFSAHLNDLRIERAFSMLTDARSGTLRISKIAFEVGFSDASYFNRMFKLRYGASPSEVRAQFCKDCGKAGDLPP